MIQYAYFRQQFLPVSEAKITVLTNSLHYGTSVFEGIRGNWNEEQQQTYIFRMKEHYERMQGNCKVMRTPLPPLDDLCRITIELISRSGLKEDVYIRPLAFKSAETIGSRLHDLDSDFCAMVFPYGKHLASEKCRAGVSSWRRLNGNSGVPMGKISGQYVNSAFVKTEATDNGFDEAIVLNEAGRVAEGSTENIFLIQGGKLITPSIYENILPGITRRTVLEIAHQELGIETCERPVDRNELYTADEAFLTGTAAHIHPVVEVDHRQIGDGTIGPVTRRLQVLYQDIIKGKISTYLNWCTPVF